MVSVSLHLYQLLKEFSFQRPEEFRNLLGTLAPPIPQNFMSFLQGDVGLGFFVCCLVDLFLCL